jgi:hypothetical protein
VGTCFGVTTHISEQPLLQRCNASKSGCVSSHVTSNFSNFLKHSTMNIFKNFAPIVLFAFAFFLGNTSTATAQSSSGTIKIQMHVEPQAAAYIKFDGIDGECTVKEGRNVVGKNTRTGEKLVVVVKNGKLSGFGVQPVGGAFKSLSPNASPCFTITCFSFNPPKCFTLPSGACVCVCGPWISSGQ